MNNLKEKPKDTVRRFAKEIERLSSEVSRLRDTLEQIASLEGEWKADGPGLAEGVLALVSEGQRDIGQEILDGIKEMKRD